MADLLSLFGNDEDLPPSCMGHPVKHVIRPSSLIKSNTESNLIRNDINKLTNGVKCSNTPIDEHKLFIHQKLRSLSCSLLPVELPPENPKGNVEYKRQLTNLSLCRLNHLTTQLKWRLREGGGEAIYEIGVDDNGKILGLEDFKLVESICNLCRMAESLNAEVIVLRERKIHHKQAIELLVRNLPVQCSTDEVRVALLGNSDSGKSTLIGVLTQGKLDNGQGKTREATFRHKHEVETGKTSTVNSQILGFDEAGVITNFYWQRSLLHEVSYEKIVSTSSKLISLIDMGGSLKYKRAAVFTLTAKQPHIVFLLMPATHGLTKVSKSHIKNCNYLNIPLVIVITKTDLESPNNSINQLKNWLSDDQTCEIIEDIVCAEKVAKKFISRQQSKDKPIIPVFYISCVSGLNLDVLTGFLANLEKCDINIDQDFGSSTPITEVWIDVIMRNVSSTVANACIVGGLIYSGNVAVGDSFYLGPQKDGSFIPVILQSIHRNRLSQINVVEGQYASFAISIDTDSMDCVSELNQDNLQKGMVLINKVPTQCNSLDYGIGLVTHSQRSIKPRIAWGLILTSISITGCSCASCYDQRRNISGSDKFLIKRSLSNSCPANLNGPDINNNDSNISNCPLRTTKYGEYWVLHCGNVNQKVKLVQNTLLCPNSNNETNNPTDDTSKINRNILVFEFTCRPQWINPSRQVVFYGPLNGHSHFNMKIDGGGQIIGLLGNRMKLSSLKPFRCMDPRKRKHAYTFTDSGIEGIKFKIDKNFTNSNDVSQISSARTSTSKSDQSDVEFITAPSSPI